MGILAYLTGIFVGFVLVVQYVGPGIDPLILVGMGEWIRINLGHSSWIFLMVLLLYSANLIRLQQLLRGNADLSRIVRLDQLSDGWIHVFVGIGVIWTAIGMRSALSTTLSEPDTLLAGDVLARLVDGGILLALTTTIVGAIGGYLMRLLKTMTIGAELVGYYRQQEKGDIKGAMDRLWRIEHHLEHLAGRAGVIDTSTGYPDSTHGTNRDLPDVQNGV